MKEEEWHKTATCHNCGKKGHIKPRCPLLNNSGKNLRKETCDHNNGDEDNEGNEDDDESVCEEQDEKKPSKNTKSSTKKKGKNSLNIGCSNEESDSEISNNASFSFLTNSREVALHNNNKTHNLRKCILLDNQSTVDIFCDKSLLSNINIVNTSMTIETNGGLLTTNQKGYLKGHGYVWYHPDAITNILSVRNVKKKYRITFDSAKDDGFIVHKPDAMVYFKEAPNGLYMHDTTHRDMVFIETVSQKMEKYTKRQYDHAVRATETYAKVGCPSMGDFKFLIQNNLIHNCPVTIEDLHVAEDIFGANINALKGKTTRRTPKVVEIDYVEVPPEIMRLHKEVTITGDIFYVQGQTFFVTLSRKIKFNTLECLDSTNTKALSQACEQVINMYSRWGFKVTDIIMDMQFEPLRSYLLQHKVILNATSANEHVGDIERFIRVVKERVRALRSRLPYTRLPPRLVIAMVRHVCRWLNVFCPKDGVSNTISPCALITGVKLDYAKHCRVEVGAYVQVHDEPHPTNNTDKERTTGAIALEHNGNLQGGYKFLSLTTGRVLDRRNFTILPVTNDVIRRVHELAGKAHNHFEF